LRGDAVLCRAVHVAGPDLYLQPFTFGSHHCGVQRLVDAETGLGDVILEPSGHRLPQRMHNAHSGIAIADLVAKNAHADEVVNIVEVAAFDDHLLVDRPVVLRTAFDHRIDLRRAQRRDDLGSYLRQVRVARGSAVGNQPHDLFVALGVQDRERQILQLPFDRGHTQPMC
jgi:hypothetical protein